jgi:elongation factor Ts
MSINAKDVQALRQATGAGMMDCKKALEESAGDVEAAKKWLREKGLAASAKRSDRDNNQGVVALSVECPLAAIVKLKCETDFVAASESFVAEAQALADLVREKGEAAVAERASKLEDLQIVLKEKIEIGEVVRFEAAAGNLMDSYVHMQGGRGVNVVLVEMSNATEELAHDIAVHIAFARPKYLTREQVPADVVASERATLETATRNEGKPEAAIAKIVDGKLNGFFKDLCLLEQPYAKDDKKSVQQVIGQATIVRFAQIEIG